jgi:hypothetical protein
MPVIPREQWKEAINKRGFRVRDFVPVVHDQDGEGACAANAATGGVEARRSIANLPFVHLAPSSLYKQSNGGRDQGSGIDTNLACLRDTGVVSVETWGGEIGWRNQYPDGFAEEAEKFRVSEWFDITSFEEFMTALIIGFPIPYGVMWEGGGGHSILATDPIYKGDDFGCLFLNSWGEDWGDHGFGEMWEQQLTDGIGYFGAWAIRSGTYSLKA